MQLTIQCTLASSVTNHSSQLELGRYETVTTQGSSQSEMECIGFLFNMRNAIAVKFSGCA